MNARTWIMGFFYGLMGLSALLAARALIENLLIGGPRVNTINSLGILVILGVWVVVLRRFRIRR